MTTHVYKSPNRFLFIASIGNPAPYTGTRHSAGHVLLDAIQPQLYERIGLITASSSSSSLPPALSRSIFYSTWKSPSLMNVSGPPVLRQLKTWLADRERYFDSISSPSSSSAPNFEASNLDSPIPHTLQVRKPSSTTLITLDHRLLKQRFRPTLVILHDELEARPGQLKVRRGGPQQASLRGHRGLISIMESLRGAGLLSTSTGPGPARNLAIMRIGIGIGRPLSRQRDSVADYVLTKMEMQELQALKAAVPEVVDLLVQEMYRKDDDEV